MALTKSFAIATGETNNDTSITSGTFNSTGFTHIVVFAKHEGTATTITISDNKSTSSWNGLNKETHSFGTNGQLFWAKIGSPGTSHTVTMTLAAARDFKGVIVWLISSGTGELELDAEAHSQGAGPSMDLGTLSTTGVSVVSFMGIAEDNTINWTNGSGWTLDANGMSGVLSTLGQSRGPETTTPIDPVASGDASIDWAGCAASFREAAAASGSLTVRRRLFAQLNSCTGPFGPKFLA